MTHPRNTQGLQASRRQAAERAAVAAWAVIHRLEHTGERLSMQAIAAEAGVSRQYLYAQPALRAAIQRLQQQPAEAGAAGPEPATPASLRTRLALAAAENRKLRQQLTALTTEQTLMRGRVHDLEFLAEELQAELARTRAQLAEARAQRVVSPAP